MKKIILAALVVASLFASCSSEKTFKKKDGSTITAKPYGWASKENKVEGVNYELNAPDVMFVGLQTLFQSEVIKVILAKLMQESTLPRKMELAQIESLYY